MRVTHICRPGAPDSRLHQLTLGQTYGNMVSVLGEPTHSRSENRLGLETFILFIPGWDIAESIWDFNPSTIQVYTYDRVGVVTVDKNNHIIRIEAQ